MIEDVIRDLQDFFDKSYVGLLSIVESLPNDDPILVIDNHDISAGSYKELTCDKSTFASEDGLSFETWLPLSVKADFTKSKAFPLLPNGRYQAQSISIMREYGLVVGGRDRWFHYSPPSWEEAKHIFPPNFEVKGVDAIYFWKAYWEIIISARARIYVLAIPRNPDLLSDIRENEPYILEHPDIQRELVEAFRSKRITEPKRKGRPYGVTQQKFELYHWVYWYRHQGLTWERSCAKVIKNYPELLPNDWTEPEDALIKQISRMDKYPRISLNSSLKKKKT